jgi:hypothetical protein
MKNLDICYQEVLDFVLSYEPELSRKDFALKVCSKWQDERRNLSFLILDNIENPAKVEKIIKSQKTIMTQIHFAFPSIEQFSHVKRNVQFKAQYCGLDEAGEPIMDRTVTLPVVAYEATVKLHGTNAGIVFLKKEDGYDVYFQSRERIITPEVDNNGFAKYAASLPKEHLDIIVANFPDDWSIVAVYGEWAGKGIQKSVAIAELPKAFYPFAAKNIVDEENGIWLNIREWVFPENIHNIYKFPTIKIDINFEEPEYNVVDINKNVLEVEAECPVGKHFGVSSIGEGLVFMPTDPQFNSSRYWFKAKGDKHANSHVKKLATVDIEKFESNKAFVENVLDEGRLQQGYQWLIDNGKPTDEKGTGDFIRWVFNDVLKENSLEMEASGIQEKDLGKLLAGPAKKWFFTKINQ